MRVHWLQHWHAKHGCRIFDGWRPEGTAAAGRSVGLGDNAGEGEPRRQGLQNGNCELGGAKEYEAHSRMVARLSGGA